MTLSQKKKREEEDDEEEEEKREKSDREGERRERKGVLNEKGGEGRKTIRPLGKLALARGHPVTTATYST